MKCKNNKIRCLVQHLFITSSGLLIECVSDRQNRWMLIPPIGVTLILSLFTLFIDKAQ